MRVPFLVDYSHDCVLPLLRWSCLRLDYFIVQVKQHCFEFGTALLDHFGKYATAIFALSIFECINFDFELFVRECCDDAVACVVTVVFVYVAAVSSVVVGVVDLLCC